MKHVNELLVAFAIFFLGSALIVSFVPRHVHAQGTFIVQGKSVGAMTNGSGGGYPTVVTMTWPTVFADAAYSASCIAEDNTANFAAAYISVRNIRNVTVSSVDVEVLAGQSGAAANNKPFVLHCVGVHN
jgi:hypothetical protein